MPETGAKNHTCECLVVHASCIGMATVPSAIAVVQFTEVRDRREPVPGLVSRMPNRTRCGPHCLLHDVSATDEAAFEAQAWVGCQTGWHERPLELFCELFL